MMVRRWLIRAANGCGGIPAHSHGSRAEGGPTVRKLGGFLAMAGATLFASWNPAVAQTPMAPCLAVDAPAPSSCGSTTTGGSGPASDPFPRTFVVANGGNKGIYVSGNTTAGVPFATVASQSNMVLTGIYLGFESSYGVSEASLYQSWKAAAAAKGVKLRLVEYSPGFIGFLPGNSQTWDWYVNALSAANMYAYNNAAGNGVTDLTMYGSLGILMLSSASSQTVPSFTYNGKTGVNAGLNVWQNYAQYFYDIYVNGLAASKYGQAGNSANPYMDGLFLDGMEPDASQFPSATWNGWRTTPVGNSASTIAEIQEGDAKLYAAIKALNPNFLVVANTAYASTLPAIDSSYRNLYDVVLQEDTIGASYSIETRSPTGFMQWMIQEEQTINANGTLVFHQVDGPGGVSLLSGNQSTWGATQWRAVRMGFAAAMQRNWHYALNCGNNNYSSPALTDEQVQTVNGVANYGWLSAGTQRLDPPQGAAWSNGVWRRRFPNGWVLWNPRGNGAQTVSIPSTLCRIKTRGYGDPGVNSGACGATTVTLQDADGLFLIGTG